MLRTCIGTTEGGSSTKGYPTPFTEAKVPPFGLNGRNGNGDISRLGRGAEEALLRTGEETIIVRRGEEELFRGGSGEKEALYRAGEEALCELLPEEIPGLPRNRPAEFSPR